MADVKISALPSLTTLADADIVPVSQSGTTKGATALTFKTYVGTGSGGVLNATASQVSGSNYTNSTNTFTNITGLTFAASANTLYIVQAFIAWTRDNVGGWQIQLNYSASGATGTFNILTPDSSSGTAAHKCVAINNSPGTFGTFLGEDAMTSVFGLVKTGSSAGNITVQACRISSGTLTVYIGSSMIVMH